MSDPVLPPEIFDYVLDLLHYDPESLKQCCLVTKSWVPRTRRYLFAHIRFYAARHVVSWRSTFPDPTNSPAPNVRTLKFDCWPGYLEEGDDWIRTFSCVVKLRLDGHPTVPFALFHGISHNLKSLEMRFIKFSCSDLFKFICSFPLLENLDLFSEEVVEDDANDLHELQTSPPLTGSLNLNVLYRTMQGIVRHLLNLPSGLRFRELVLILVVENDIWWLNELVLRCSDTLEWLDIMYRRSASPNSIDLSQAKKLKVLKVRLTYLSPNRLIATLETITAEHRDLREISIYLPFKHIPHGEFRSYFIGDLYEKWLKLDRLLVQFWELHSIRTMVMVTDSNWGNQEMDGRIGSLFPEMTRRGIIDLIEEY